MQNLTSTTPNLGVLMLQESIIIRELLTNSDYYLKVIDYLKKDMFNDIPAQEIIKSIKKLSAKYNGNQPSMADVALDLEVNLSFINDKLYGDCAYYLHEIKQNTEPVIKEHLVDNTQKWVKDKLLKQAIILGAEKIETNQDISSVYAMLGDAIALSFDKNLGVSSNDIDARIDRYHERAKIALTTGVKDLDMRLGGGFMDKSLNIVGAVTHGGKSLLLSHVCAHNLKLGKNGVYITLEMPETEIWRRIDANVLKRDINTFCDITREELANAYANLSAKVHIKEYSPGTCSVVTIRNYLKDLEVSDNFKPDFICIDYLTLMKSSRVELSKVKDYQYPRYIAEELHALAKELSIPIVTASQLNRGAFKKMDSGVEDIGESIGISQTADVFLTLNRSDELDRKSQMLVNISKNRNSGKLESFVIGIDFPTMTFYDVGDSRISNDLHYTTLNSNPQLNEDWESISLPGFSTPSPKEQVVTYTPSNIDEEEEIPF